MKSKFKKMILVAAVSALGLAGSASANPLLDLSVLGSTTQGSGYSGSLSGISSGTTIYYEIVAQYATAGTTNANTTKSPNGTQDSANSLPYLNLSDSGGTFNTDAALASFFALGTGNSTGNNSGSAITSIRAIGANGVFTNLDAQTVILTGSFVTAATTTGIGLAENAAGAAGSLKIGGTGPSSIVGANGTTESSADPIISTAGLTISGEASPVPGPSTIGGFLALSGVVGGLGLVRRGSKLA